MRTGPQTWPDVTLLVREWLAANLSGIAIGTQVPAENIPSIRVQRVGGPRTQVLDVARVLIECRHSTEGYAYAVVADVRDLMRRIPGSHDEGVVSGVEEIGGPAYLPDPVTAQPRYTLTCLVHVKPADFTPSA
jgi:hypothetical protein